MTMRDRALEAMNRTNDILEAKARARAVEAKLVDVSALAHGMGAPFAVEVAGQVWRAAEPPTDAGEMTRDDYLRAIVAGVLAELDKGKGALVFAFRATRATPAGVPLPPAACHNLTFKAEAIGDPFDPKVLVTVLGDRLAVPVGAR
jgi:hypothetical protein